MPRKARKVKGISVGFDKRTKAWRIFFHINNHRWTESRPDKAIAYADAEEYGKRLLRGEDIRPVEKRPPAPRPTDAKPGTLRAEAAHWLISGQRQRKSGSNTYYATNLEEHIFPALGEVLVTDRGLTREVCMDFASGLIGKVSTMTGRPLRYATRKGVIRTLSAFCTWARNRRGATLTHNPAEGLIDFVFDPDELTRQMVVWTWDEVERLIATADQHYPQWRVLLELALKTGLRLSELIELQWDLDFTRPGEIHVQRQFQTRRRKTWRTDDTGGLVNDVDVQAPQVVPLKGKESRIVPLWGLASESLLKEHRAAQRKAAFRRGEKAPALVFVGAQGRRINLSYFEWRVLPKICERAGVTVTRKMHATRHTFATVLLYAGVELPKVSEWMGHSETATTERHYKHWIRDVRRDEVIRRQVEAAWGGK